MVASVVAVLVGAWLGAVLCLVLAYRRRIRDLWLQPVFARPILVLESDDWGAGPLTQASALDAIAATLGRHLDEAGRSASMNLALVLAVPDGPSMAADGGYRRIELDAPMFSPVLTALRAGMRQRVFSAQLHGHEHYWPPALLGLGDPAVRAWLRQVPPAVTEQLPSHLQSRWVDASRLPSTSLPADQIRSAIDAEVAAYRRILGEQPVVVVPPTFVWTREVEKAWAAAGLEFVVTPGWRYTQRGADGMPGGDEGPIRHGDRAGGLSYVVRTDYFEPARGRGASHALQAMYRTVVEGLPCVLENHRDNFIASAEQAQHSLQELDALLKLALQRHPALRFLSTFELGSILRDRDPEWIVQPWRDRIPFVWQRFRNSGRLWKLMRLTGLAMVGALLVELLSRPTRSVTTRPDS